MVEGSSEAQRVVAARLPCRSEIDVSKNSTALSEFPLEVERGSKMIKYTCVFRIKEASTTQPYSLQGHELYFLLIPL